MKKLLCVCLLAALCAALPLSSNAEELDMGKFTCGDFLKLGGDESAMLYFWLDGYASHVTGNNVLNSSAVEGDMKALMELCQKNPSLKILDIFKTR